MGWAIENPIKAIVLLIVINVAFVLINVYALTPIVKNFMLIFWLMWVITLILSILYVVYIVIEHGKLVNERDMEKQKQLAN